MDQLGGNQVVTMQFSVVVLLAIIWLRAATAFNDRVFRILGYAWIANLLYLGASSGIVLKALPQFDRDFFRLLARISDFTASALFWYTAHQGSRSKRRIYLSDWPGASFCAIPILLFLIFVFLDRLPPKHSNHWAFVIAIMPSLALDVVAITSLAFFFKDRISDIDITQPRNRGQLLFLGTMFYAATQFLRVFEFGSAVGTVQNIGFICGLAAKLLILLGTVELLVEATGASIRSIADQVRLRELSSQIDILAHELGTPISEILIRLGDLSQPSKLHNAIRKIESAASRADALLIASKLTSKKTKPALSDRSDTGTAAEEPEINERQVVSANTLIEMAQNAVQSTRKELVSFRHQYSGNCCIECIPTEIIQIIINIFRNSYDAMAEGFGVIDVRTQNDRGTESDTANKSLGKVIVVIRDDGEGISEENMSKIFDLGFSTRPGDGRGHGLAVVRALAESNGINLELNSPPARTPALKGTEIILTFPRVQCSSYRNSK